jgi:hypothetical protein
LEKNKFNKSSSDLSFNALASVSIHEASEQDESTSNLNGNVINDSKLIYKPKKWLIDDFDTVKKNSSSSNNIESTSEK